MTPAQKGLILAGGTAVLAALMLKSKPARAATKPSGECSPYKWDPMAVAALIEDERRSGTADPEHIAISVATQLFSNHPSGRTVAFPPASDAPSGVLCVYGKVRDMVNEALGHWRELIDHWTASPRVPRTGMFYIQSKGEIFFGNSVIIGSVLQEAGIQNTETNRANYLYAMECSPFNDAVYNVDLDADGLKNRARTWWPRGISQTPRYVNNYQRAIIGRSFKRGSGNEFAMAWLPMAEATQDGEFMISMWPDGTSAINPPAEVMALGFDNVPPKQYGCGSERFSGSKLQIS